MSYSNLRCLKRYWVVWCLLLGSGASWAIDMPAPAPRLGMNLNGPADWNSELPLVDVFRLSRRWISQKQGAAWGQGPQLDLDKHGWVTQLQQGCWAETLMCTIEGGHYPAGAYTVLYEGQGEVTIGNAVRAVSQQPGRMVAEVDPSRGAIFLQIRQTDPEDYVRNMRVIMPGFEATYQAEPFHPVFLKRWQGVACFRFMDWMHTNGSKIQTWEDRPKPEDATFTVHGMSLELMIDLCNRQQADAWFCMPHLATDDYVRQFAKQVKSQLDPNLSVYVEYSNEVWNSQFAQTRYSWEQAKILGLGDPARPWEGGGMFYAQRSVEMFKIWEAVFGGVERLVRVLAWQSGNTWWMEKIILPHKEAHKQADALAIAPYMGFSVRPAGEGITADQVATWSVDRALDHMAQNVLPKSIQAMQATKATADTYGLTLIAYEGGQHMVGVAGGENNEAMTRLFHEANAHARMGTLYDAYYQAWTEAGGGLHCAFSSVGRWSKWGSWGLMQTHDDDPRDAPKLLSTLRWAEACGQAVHVPQ
jgi:hypothetical protein